MQIKDIKTNFIVKIISETASAYSKSLSMRYYTSLHDTWFKSTFFNIANGGHFGFMQITRIVQRCCYGNQSKFVLGPHMSTNQQKNFIQENISRFSIEGIGASTRLYLLFVGEPMPSSKDLR